MIVSLAQYLAMSPAQKTRVTEIDLRIDDDAFSSSIDLGQKRISDPEREEKVYTYGRESQ